MIVALRAKSVCTFAPLMKTDMDTKFVCKSCDEFRFHRIEKKQKNGFGSFSFVFRLHKSWPRNIYWLVIELIELLHKLMPKFSPWSQGRKTSSR